MSTVQDRRELRLQNRAKNREAARTKKAQKQAAKEAKRIKGIANIPVSTYIPQHCHCHYNDSSSNGASKSTDGRGGFQ